MAETAFGQWWEENIYNPGRNILLGEDNPVGNIGQGLQNAFYDLTGQDEKTSFYKAQVERENELIARQEQREDTAMQRGAADAAAAGLSKYGMTPGAAGSAAGGSSSVHSGSESISKISAMLDMRKAIAEIGNVQANTNKTNAEAAATTASVERDDNYYKLAALKNDSDIARNECLNQLTKNQSAQVAEETLATIDKRARENESHLYDMVAKSYDNLLKLKDIGTYEERHKAEMSLKESSTFLNQAKAREASEHEKLYQEQQAEIQKEIERIAADIALKEAEKNHLGYQDQLLVEDTAYRILQYNVMAYNARYSAEVGLRTTDASTYISGLNTSQLGKLGSNILLGANPAGWFGFRGNWNVSSAYPQI